MLTYCLKHSKIKLGDSMSLLKVFANNLRMYRLKKGLTQDGLAALTGLHRTYISAVERGKRSIALDNIEKIANALEIEAPLLFVKSSEN